LCCSTSTPTGNEPKVYDDDVDADEEDDSQLSSPAVKSKYRRGQKSINQAARLEIGS